MSKKYFRRFIDNLENRAEERLEKEVMDIFRRYGWNSKRVIEQGSSYELEVVDRWSQPIIDEMIECVLPIIAPSVIIRFLELCVYPIILRINPKDDDEGLVGHFDFLYKQIKYSHLWRQFIEEHEHSPEFGKEGWDTWTISQELVEKFKVADADIESMKKKIRRKLIEDYKEKIKLLREEENLEATREMEETLAEIECCD